jgi:hypothetical protein
MYVCTGFQDDTSSIQGGCSCVQGSQNRGKPLGYRGNRPNRAGSVTKTDR